MTTIRMSRNGPQLAFWLMTPHEVVCEIAGMLGFSIAILDLEHGTFETSSAARLIAAGRSHGLNVLTRVDSPTRVPIQHALDFGSDGVIVPQLEDLEHAREAMALTKYPPLGNRGFGGGRTVRFQSAPSHFVDAENRRTRCFAMIETVGGLDDVEAIARLETVDGLFIGPNDLSLARGRGEYRADGSDHDDIRRIAEAARAANKPWAMPVHSEVDRAFARSLGIAFMAVTDDITALREGLGVSLERARSGDAAALPPVRFEDRR